MTPDPRDVALAWSDSDVGVKRCHACWAWFPTDEFRSRAEAGVAAVLAPQVVAEGRHAVGCDGVCRVPDCETHG